MPIKKPVSIAKLKESVPHSVESERALLSSMMQSKEIATEIFGKVTKDDFFIPAHQVIYDRMLKDWEKSINFDLIAFTERLIDDKLILQLGGAAEITAIYNLVPSPANYKQYLEIVLEKSMGRKLIKLCTESAEKVINEPDSVRSTLVELQNQSREIKPYEEIPTRTLKDDILD